MRIAVCSDSHRGRGNISLMLKELPPVDALCFLGDVDEDAGEIREELAFRQPHADFYTVSGNCDFFPSYATSLIMDAKRVRILLCHGHLYHVKETLSLLSTQAREKGCDMAFFGHTHCPTNCIKNGVRLINPGALRKSEYALVEIPDEGEISVSLCTLER